MRTLPAAVILMPRWWGRRSSSRYFDPGSSWSPST